MRNFGVVYCLAVLFCLVVCVSANDQITLEIATKAVTDAKSSVNAVRARAQTELDKATALLQKVESSKNKGDEASLKAETVATDNTKAEEIATQIKSIAQTVATSYPEAKQKMDNAVKSLTTLQSDTQKLDDGSGIQIPPNGDPTPDYTETNRKAIDLKAQADALDKSINDALALFEGVNAKANEMAEKTKEAQLKSLKVRGIVAVAKIETMIGEADGIITKTKNKKNEVNNIVTEMQKLKEKALTESIDSINTLVQDASGELTKATGAVDSSVKDNAAMTKQKKDAEAALAKVEKTNQVSEAQEEVEKAEKCFTNAEQIVQKLKSELQTAETFVTNAKALKQKLMTLLLTTTTAPNTVQATETAKADPSVEQGREPDQKEITIQPTSKELPEQSNNSSDKRKDELNKGAQNVATTALTGGKAPAPGANNDSAMTVSVPLLVALIASAVLQ